MRFLERYRKRRKQGGEVIYSARELGLPRTTRIKSHRMRHDWQITGTGRIEEFRTTSARCTRCGEEVRDFLAPFDEFMVLRASGCWRDDFDGRYQRDDLVIVGHRLDYFVNYLPDGKCATANAGGGTYTQDVADLVAVV